MAWLFAALGGLAVLLFLGGLANVPATLSGGTGSKSRGVNPAHPVVRRDRGLVTASKGQKSSVDLAWDRWKRSWTDLAIRSRFGKNAANLPIIMAVIPPVAFLLGTLITGGSWQFGLFAAIAPVGATWVVLTFRGRKYDVILEDQIGGWLTSFGMYTEAGMRPVNALVASVDSSPPEIRQVLSFLVTAVNNNMSPADALLELKQTTSNPILAEVCTNTRIALRSGQSLTTQLNLLAEQVRVAANIRAEANRELLTPRILSLVVAFMAPVMYLIIALGMPDWSQQFQDDLIGQIVLFVTFGANLLGAYLLFRVLLKAGRD